MSIQVHEANTHIEPLAEALVSSAPGVEVVLPSAAIDSALDVQSMRLLGVLQRRTWKHQRTMMQRRSMKAISLVSEPFEPIAVTNPLHVDLIGASSWDERLTVLRAAVSHFADDASGHDVVVSTRGWDSTEAGVLVDGRAASGAAFDVATMVSTCVDQFRRGEQPFAFLVPEPDDASAAKLWAELISIAEDRLGIDRGTVRFTSTLTNNA